MALRRILLAVAAYALAVAVLVAANPGRSQAIPAFSRQTGEGCLTCHFLTFPALNAYGREFKRRAYTYVREEALVERNGTLSIPVVLNASLVINAKYTNTNSNVTPGSTSGPGYSDGSWSLPVEAPLLVAGRLGRNVGFFGSLGQVDGTSANGKLAKNWKVVSSFEVAGGGFRIGLNLFNTAYGWTAGLETTNVFGQHGGVMNGSDVTALTNIGMTRLNMQGMTLWAGNRLWTIGISGVVPDVYKVGNNFGGHLIPGVRVAFTPTIMGWDVDVGGGMLNGTAGGIDPATDKRFAGAHMDFLDAQVQGHIDDVGIGVYADYAYTIAKSGVKYNLFGATPLEMDGTGALIGGDAAAGDRTGGWSLRAMAKPIEGWIFGGGYGQTRNKTAAGVSSTSSIWNIGVIREIYSNAELKLLYGEQRLGALYPSNTAGYVQITRSTTLQFEALM